LIFCKNLIHSIAENDLQVTGFVLKLKKAMFLENGPQPWRVFDTSQIALNRLIFFVKSLSYEHFAQFS
jgi:hypothetical protein